LHKVDANMSELLPLLQRILRGLGHCKGEDDARYDQLYVALVKLLRLDGREEEQEQEPEDLGHDSPVGTFVRDLDCFTCFKVRIYMRGLSIHFWSFLIPV